MNNDHGIWTNLRGEACVCGDPKLPGKSFCKRDYFKLPQPMRSALYDRNGYVAAFRAALAFLELAEPTCEPATLSDVFPIDRGPIRRNPFRSRFRR